MIDGGTPLTRAAVRSQLRDQAAAHVRDLIASGQAAPGSHLPLELLARRIGISVTPVREALLLLAQDGVVTQEPNRGFRVTPVRRRDIADTYLVYATVAGELAARAATRIDTRSLGHLRLLDERLKLIGPNDYDRLEEANYGLHDVIYEVAGAPRLVWFTAAAGRFVPRRYWAVVPGWYEWNKSAHTPIIDALERREPEAARAAMSAHALAACDLLIAQLDSLSLLDD